MLFLRSLACLLEHTNSRSGILQTLPHLIHSFHCGWKTTDPKSKGNGFCLKNALLMPIRCTWASFPPQFQPSLNYSPWFFKVIFSITVVFKLGNVHMYLKCHKNPSTKYMDTDSVLRINFQNLRFPKILSSICLTTHLCSKVHSRTLTCPPAIILLPLYSRKT